MSQIKALSIISHLVMIKCWRETLHHMQFLYQKYHLTGYKMKKNDSLLSLNSFTEIKEEDNRVSEEDRLITVPPARQETTTQTLVLRNPCAGMWYIYAHQGCI